MLLHLLLLFYSVFLCKRFYWFFENDSLFSQSVLHHRANNNFLCTPLYVQYVAAYFMYKFGS